MTATTTRAAPPVRFVCSKCGGPNVKVNDALTAMDPRYPIGWCERCTPVPKAGRRPGTDGSKPHHWHTPPRKTIALVRADLDDPEDRAHRARVKHARQLARKLHDPKHSTKMSPAELKQASEAVLWLRRAD